MRRFFTFMVISFLISCNDRKPQTPVNTGITSEIYQVNNNWAYKIFIDNKLLIAQEHIPALEGNHFFTTKEAAEKTALLVKQKIERHEKPLLSVEELRKEGIVE